MSRDPRTTILSLMSHTHVSRITRHAILPPHVGGYGGFFQRRRLLSTIAVARSISRLKPSIVCVTSMICSRA